MCRTHAAAGCPATALRSAVSVLSMQGGFALLGERGVAVVAGSRADSETVRPAPWHPSAEAGSVRQENKSNIMLKNLYDMVLGILGWWIVGWGLACATERSRASSILRQALAPLLAQRQCHRLSRHAPLPLSRVTPQMARTLALACSALASSWPATSAAWRTGRSRCHTLPQLPRSTPGLSRSVCGLVPT